VHLRSPHPRRFAAAAGPAAGLRAGARRSLADRWLADGRIVPDLLIHE